MLYISVAGVVGTPRLKFWPPQQQCSPVLWSATNNIKARPSRWAVQRSVNPAGRSVPLSDDDSSNYISRYDGSLKGSDVLALANELADDPAQLQALARVTAERWLDSRGTDSSNKQAASGSFSHSISYVDSMEESMEESSGTDEDRCFPSGGHDPRVASYTAHTSSSSPSSGSTAAGRSIADVPAGHPMHYESGFAAATRGDAAAAYAAGGGSDRLYDSAPIPMDGNRVGGMIVWTESMDERYLMTHTDVKANKATISTPLEPLNAQRQEGQGDDTPRQQEGDGMQ